ncbi:MAG: AAA family ATPase, partial [Pseudomonadota bacterium]
MHIRKLEIHGFKSFPDRVVFHFSDGISGIVGPNGCGKSNVLDAMKWCIGEQSAKELRGQAMEDVVFSGSQGRASMSMAQVIMTFGAGDRPFAGDWARFDEVQISRRILRGGGSEYRINQHRVRLKDVQDLFLDTGAGNRFYSFIEQGRIGAVITASAQERRGLLEEAAGTSRYKARRAETLTRLDHTLANLERSAHVVEELELRLEQLAKQVDKAARFRRYRAIVAQASLLLALARYGGLRQDRKVLNADLRAASAERERRERQLTHAGAELGREKEQAEVVDAVVGGIKDQLAELEATRRELESARQYQERERADLTERGRRLAVELEQAGARVARQEQELSATERAAEACVADIDAARDAVASQDARCAASGRELGIVRDLRDRRRRVVMDHRAVAERAGARAETLAQQQARIREDLEGRDKDLGAAKAEAERLVQARADAEVQREAAKGRQALLGEALAAAQAAWTAAEGEVRAAVELRQRAEQGVVAVERDLAQVRGRRDSLRDLAGRHEGLADASRRVLQAIPGAFALAEELEVPEALLEPLALALGEHSDLVVLAGAADLRRAVEVAGQGSAWLLLAEGSAPLPEEGLAAEIGGTHRARRALGRVLGRCTIAGDLEEALARAAAGWTVVHGGALRLDPGGLVRLGRGGPAAVGVLSRRRVLAEAEQRCAELEAAAAG